MAEYSMSFDELMALPIKRFWFLANQVDRIRAERDLRQLQMLGSATSLEAYKMANEHLNGQVGQVYVWAPVAPGEIKINPDTGLDAEFDRAGLDMLKAKYGRQNK
jgi:hypothetical protein